MSEELTVADEAARRRGRSAVAGLAAEDVEAEETQTEQNRRESTVWNGHRTQGCRAGRGRISLSTRQMPFSDIVAGIIAVVVL